MEWVKLELKLIRSREYIGSDPSARATWVNLLSYCADKENGGRICDCLSWKDRMWQQICGVTLEETRIKTELYSWDGEDLLIRFYPEAEEDLIQKRRAAGRAGASSRWQNREVPMAKGEGANRDQTRPEERRPDKSRAEGELEAAALACKGLDWGEIEDWMDLVGRAIPERKRAESLAREFLEEMEAKDWVLKGIPVDSPLALLVSRLKKDKAYTPRLNK